MTNKIWKEYIEKVHNENSNYEKILLKMKGGMHMRKKVLSIAATFLIVLVVGATSSSLYAKIKWEIAFKEYQKAPVEETSGNLDILRDSGYAEVLNMDYVVQDGICIKVDSILLTDDCLDINWSVKFPEEKQVNSETFSYSFAVYDENKNVYFIAARTRAGEKREYATPFIYKELGVKYNAENYYEIQLSDGATYGLIEVNEKERSMVQNMTIRAKDVFPQSKKLYIQIFDLGYDMYDLSTFDYEKHTIGTKESFDISDARWIFEIDVPEKFYERNTVELKLAEEIPDFEIEKATISETSFVLIFKSKAYRNIISEGKDMEAEEFANALKNMLIITDGEGNSYQEVLGGGKGKESYKMILDVGKKDLEKGLFVNFTIDGKKYTRELIEK